MGLGFGIKKTPAETRFAWIAPFFIFHSHDFHGKTIILSFSELVHVGRHALWREDHLIKVFSFVFSNTRVAAVLVRRARIENVQEQLSLPAQEKIHNCSFSALRIPKQHVAFFYFK